MLTIDLTGKTALVIGGSRGIGAAITQCLAKAGAHVVFTHTGNAAYAERVRVLLASVKDGGGTAEAVVLDACASADATALVSRIVAGHGRVDVLVHNAGHGFGDFGEYGDPIEPSYAEISRTILDFFDQHLR